MSDEIITEVHAIKDALSERFKGNIHELFEEIKKGEDELRASGFHLNVDFDSFAGLGWGWHIDLHRHQLARGLRS